MIGGERRCSLTFTDWLEDPPREGDWIQNENTGTTYEITSEPTRSPSIVGRYYFDQIRLDKWGGDIPREERPDRAWSITYRRR